MLQAQMIEDIKRIIKDLNEELIKRKTMRVAHPVLARYVDQIEERIESFQRMLSSLGEEREA